MNAPNNGSCSVNLGSEWNTFYNVQADVKGNSQVTGEGGEQLGYEKKFTCEELEVYQVWF